MKGYDVVVSSTAGGNYTMDFFVDQAESWSRQPVMEDLLALKALAGRSIDIVEEIRVRLGSSLEYLVLRERPCTQDGGVVRLVGTRHGHRVDEIVERRGDSIYYQPSSDDLLGITTLSPYRGSPPDPIKARYTELLGKSRRADREDASTWLRESEWRELTCFTAKPDSVPQIAHLYDTDLAGTINLFPAPMIAFNSVVPGRHAGEHFHEKDAFVGVWGRPVTRTTRVEFAVNGSVAASIYAYLSGETVKAGTDGWGFEAIPFTDAA